MQKCGLKMHPCSSFRLLLFSICFFLLSFLFILLVRDTWRVHTSDRILSQRWSPMGRILNQGTCSKYTWNGSLVPHGRLLSDLDWVDDSTRVLMLIVQRTDDERYPEQTSFFFFFVIVISEWFNYIRKNFESSNMYFIHWLVCKLFPGRLDFLQCEKGQRLNV